MDHAQPKTARTDVDVIIIGAGISGLTAAHKILKNRPQAKVIVLEAKGRVGGRIAGVTLKTASGTDTWDIGGQWIGRNQQDIIKLMAELDIEHYPQWYSGGKILELSDGQVSKYEASYPNLPYLSLLDLYWNNTKLENLCKEVPLDDAYGCPRARELDEMTVETWKQQNAWTTSLKELLDIAMGAAYGVTPAQMSMLVFLQILHSAGGWAKTVESGLEGGAQEWRITGTAHGMTLRLAEKIGTKNILVNQVVKAITQEDGGVLVTTHAGQNFWAERIVLAIPPSEAVKIDFNPPLPSSKSYLMQNMAISNLTKFIATYTTAFWRKAGLSGESAHSSGPGMCNTNPICVTFDGTTDNGSPAIVGFVTSYAAARWSQKKEPEMRKAILAALERYFGPEAGTPLDFVVKDWSLEKWSGGCPANFMTPGTLTNYGNCLKEPYQRIHWAGTETSEVCHGYMSGGVHAGWRAAQEVLNELT